MATVLIVEDDLLIANSFENYVRLFKHQVIGKVTTGEAALKFVEKQVPNIILMDIKLASSMTGIEAAQQIKKRDTVGVIYLTTLANALEKISKTPPPYHFMDKPIRPRDLRIALSTMENQVHEIRKLQTSEEEVIQMSLPNIKSVRFPLTSDDVLYVKANKSECTVFTSKENSYLSMSLKDFMEEYRHPDFMRIHKSYMINVSKIRGVKSHKVYLLSSKKEEKEVLIPIGRSYREAFYERFPYFRK